MENENFYTIVNLIDILCKPCNAVNAPNADFVVISAIFIFTARQHSLLCRALY